MKNRTTSGPKPKKPRRDFPLYAHSRGQWAKKVRWGSKQRTVYCGRWDDPEAAEARWDEEKEYWLRECFPPSIDPVPRHRPDHPTVKELCDAYVGFKQNKYRAGDITVSTFRMCYDCAAVLVKFFGRDRRVDSIGISDFTELRRSVSKGLMPSSLKARINGIKGVFRWGFRNEFIAEPMRYGDEFDPPSAKRIRQEKLAGGLRLFTPEEIRAILEASNEMMRAWVLLGLNAGYGATDIARLPKSAVDLTTGWIHFPRPKTAVDRRVPLWPETLAALRVAMEERPDPFKDEWEDLVFLTKTGRPCVRHVLVDPTKPETSSHYDCIGQQFCAILRKLGINGRRGIGFYSLRRTFATISQRAGLPIATNFVMGHADNSMAAIYRQEVFEDHLRTVVDAVRNWVWPKSEGGDA